ncbi:hypothetical protein NQ318_022129, partial [Aromia moschata]
LPQYFLLHYRSFYSSSKQQVYPYCCILTINTVIDIEEQLEMAEDRCNTLKDQLDYMKQIYGVNKHAPKTRKISNISTSKKSSDDKLSGSSLTDEANDKDSKRYLKRQNSNAISTDNTGAAVRTINNILNGITDSVNRLSELRVQISETPRSRVGRSTGVSPQNLSRSSTEVKIKKNTTDESGVMQDIMLGSSTRISIKSKSIKKKSKDSSKMANKKPVASHMSIRKSAKSDKKNKGSLRSSMIDRELCTLKKKKILNIKPNAQTHKLVEIYHNNAVKNSDSDEGHQIAARLRSRVQHKKYVDSSHSNKSLINEIPPLNIQERNEHVSSKVQTYGNNPMCPRLDLLQAVKPEGYEPPQAPRTEVSCYSKNYELPTIASKMKQVAKSYLNSFNLKAIPFCAAISTTPSHNIGINIQQVMNIIKTKQSVNGISPTLAHNIGLAAERINSRPLSALVSTINSRTEYRCSRCPLSRTLFNYQQLQEMAKGIPEETAEEVEEAADSPAMKTVIITGPSGDMEVKNRNVPAWGVDPAHRDQCTCIPSSGVEFQQIVNKYNRKNTPMTAKTIESQVDNRFSKYNMSNKRKSQTPNKKVSHTKNGYSTNTVNSATAGENQDVEANPFHGREKNLKEVLTNLHNEFESLNKRYEDLSQKANPDDAETLKELESMETELNKKEEEITMVMALYKEVLALKQQIKTLKQRASQASLNVNDPKDSSAKFKEYNNPQAAFHLTKLLRQIQHYQLRYKKEVNRM